MEKRGQVWIETVLYTLVGLALMGKRINDEVEVDAPVGKITYKIISIT